MKRSLVILLMLVLNVGAFAQGTNPREGMWIKAIQAYMKADSIAVPQKGQILFVGSSSINMWKDIDTYFPGYDIIKRGVGGTCLEDIIYFAEQIVFPYQPRQIVLYEGDNDLANGFTPQRYLDELKVFVRLVEIRYPKTPILILSVKPSPSRHALLGKYIETNVLLKEFAKDDPNLTFVDTTPSVMHDGFYNKEAFVSDSLHLSRKAYLEWAELITPHLIKK